MAITCTVTTGGLNLNDKTNYILRYLDVGTMPRDEVWIEPFAAGAAPLLAAAVDRKTQLTFSLIVLGTSIASLKTNVDAILTAFNQNNSVVWSAGTGVATKTFVTYQSVINPPVVSEADLRNATVGWAVDNWTFNVWRHPYVSSSPVIF